MQVSKTRKIIGWIITGLPLSALCFSSFGKLSGNEEMTELLAKINITNPPLLGSILLVCLILYLVPKTSNIGFFLLCSYFGGVIVGEIGQGGSPMLGISMCTLFYVGTMLRKPELSGLGI